MRRTIGALASSLALAATLSACGGDPEPRFEAEPSVAPSTASPSASAEPEPWEERTPEGAVAFAKHWTATFSEAFQTGDTTNLSALSAPECETCRTFIDLIDSVYGDGGSISGESWSLEDPGWVQSGRDFIVTGRMEIPEQVITRSGQDPEPAAPLTRRYIFTIEWSGEGWQAERVVRQA